ncbi:hypothetical protein FQR65_LT07525 [Abscondita terminalis]|nr:hypothetical protein FQR65_LT07525 [Abscondita terminalis]
MTILDTELLWNITHTDYVNKVKRESAIMKLMVNLTDQGVPITDVAFLRALDTLLSKTFVIKSLFILCCVNPNLAIVFVYHLDNLPEPNKFAYVDNENKLKVSELGDASSNATDCITLLPKQDEHLNEFKALVDSKVYPLPVILCKIRGPKGMRRVYVVPDSGATITGIVDKICGEIGIGGTPFLHTYKGIGGIVHKEEAN